MSFLGFGLLEGETKLSMFEWWRQSCFVLQSYKTLLVEFYLWLVCMELAAGNGLDLCQRDRWGRSTSAAP